MLEQPRREPGLLQVQIPVQKPTQRILQIRELSCKQIPPGADNQEEVRPKDAFPAEEQPILWSNLEQHLHGAP